MNQEKLHFLKYEFIPLLQMLQADVPGKWGVMHGQEMVEHFIDAVKSANGKLVLPAVNEGEMLEKSRIFLMTEKPFKENTKNPLIATIPSPLRKPNIREAIQKLQEELDYFFTSFETNPSLTTFNPIFGDLDYAMNVQLLHKHALHHLRQFGLIA
jgi:hypothetical protein